MKAKGFLAGLALVVVCCWVINNWPIKIPLHLENIECPIEDHKAALINFGKFQLYQPCLHPSNVKNGIKNLDIEVYYTGSKVDCPQKGALMCDLLGMQYLSQDKNLKMSYAHYTLNSSNIRSQFNFNYVPAQVVNERFDSDLKIDAKELITPSAITVEQPIICNMRSGGAEIRCDLYFRKFGVLFAATYEKPTEVAVLSKIDALQDITLWLGVADHFIVEAHK